MPHKKSTKPASTAPTSPRLSPTLSDATKRGARSAAFTPQQVTTTFLAKMDQNRCLASKFTDEEIIHLVPDINDLRVVMDDLKCMDFQHLITTGPPKAAEPIAIDNNEDNTLSYASEYEEEPLSFASVDQFLQRMIDWTKAPSSKDVHSDASQALLQSIVRKIYKLSKEYEIFDRVHKCPKPQPCNRQHSDDPLPCPRLHAEDVPTPPPCPLPHRVDEDIPMEPAAPPCILSEAATQTLAPSHEASRPQPPPANAASSPAVAASTPPAGP
ncbi:hypothetical protein P691DRAFT_768458, partial [Macrolepiota fuliginosa MF-IS2]